VDNEELVRNQPCLKLKKTRLIANKLLVIHLDGHMI